jgi:N utilization substance protein B
MLYQTEIGQMPVGEAAQYHGVVGGADAIDLDEEAHDYAAELARGSWQAKDALDTYIGDAAQNWRVERLAVVDRLLLRLAIHELLNFPGTPPRVVIDEAIELARSYSGDEAARFVNGILDAIYRRLKGEGKVVD